MGQHSDTADMRPPITRQPTRLHRAGSVPCKPKTLKMSAYGTFSPTARPPRVLPTPWALPTPRSPRGRGAGKTSCTLTTERWVASTCKGQAATRFFASLDRFPAPSASVSLLPPRRWRGVKGRRSRAFLPLTPWNRPNTHRRGRWIGFATCPCGPRKCEWGLGQSPKGLFFVFEVVRVDVTVQKRSKNVHFRIFATKNTANLANF